jgi:hypothetical protein
MLSAIARRLSYANVAATLALFFSISGAALAAHHYLVNSTSQINPKVVKALRGHTGTKGATGATGATGTAGAAGASGAAGAKGAIGEPGPLLGTLPSGKSETGSFASADFRPEGASGVTWVLASISYPFALAAEPSIEIVQAGATPGPNCPGSIGSPAAKPGYLCVFVGVAFEVEGEAVSVEPPNYLAGEYYLHGAVVYTRTVQSGPEPHTGQISGSWAVTAP